MQYIIIIIIIIISLSLSIYIYIYTSLSLHICIYIYIYIHIHGHPYTHIIEAFEDDPMFIGLAERAARDVTYSAPAKRVLSPTGT